MLKGNNLSGLVTSVAVVALVFISGKTYKVIEESSKRQEAIDLYNVWTGVVGLEAPNPDPYDVIKVSNAMELTARLWVNNLVDKKFVLEALRESFKFFYKLLNDPDTIVKNPDGSERSGQSYLCHEIHIAYNAMQQYTNLQ